MKKMGIIALYRQSAINILVFRETFQNASVKGPQLHQVVGNEIFSGSLNNRQSRTQSNLQHFLILLTVVLQPL